MTTDRIPALAAIGVGALFGAPVAVTGAAQLPLFGEEAV